MAELLMICVKSGTKFTDEYGYIDEWFHDSVESFTSVWGEETWNIMRINP
jgi:hypothetical protein